MTGLLLTVRLAWRNVVRYARRSVITGVTISAGLVMLIVAVGVSEGSYRRAVDTAARSGAGHVSIQVRDLDVFAPTPLPHPDRVLAAARAVPGALVAPRAEAAVLLQGTGGSANLLALGVDAVTERDASILPASMVDGAWLDDAPGRVAQAVVGRATAERMGLETGDRVVLMVQAAGEVQSLLARVVGVFATGSDEVDGGMVVTHLQSLQQLLVAPGAVHRVAVVLDDLQRARSVADALQAELPDTEVLTWAEAVPELGDFIKMDRAGGDATFLLLFAIVSLAVLNAVLMSVFERLRELGLMLALGTSPLTLFGMVLVEALMLSVSASLVGAALGGGLVLHLGHTGVDFTALAGIEGSADIGGYDISGTIHPYLPVRRTLLDMLAVIGITTSVSLYPAWKAARVEPVAAINGI
ncbi:MAG: ABC transporter permease [Alphaproteobacteria bacterium]|nr:ABC transporter permease [Alphaproteobacteria bacterium]